MTKRILLKLTGELFGSERYNIDFEERVRRIAKYIAALKRKMDIDIVIVVGAGNLFRGRNLKDSEFDRAQADHIGMLATVMNALALQGELNLLRADCRVMSSLKVEQACEPYIRLKAKRHLEKGRIVILAGGLGRPFCTTDTAAAQMAAELDCEILLKGSNTDAVYAEDPRVNPNAIRYETLTYQEALEQGLMVMDSTAFAVCQNEKIPIVVFDIGDLENIERILNDEKIGTLIT